MRMLFTSAMKQSRHYAHHLWWHTLEVHHQCAPVFVLSDWVVLHGLAEALHLLIHM